MVNWNEFAWNEGQWGEAGVPDPLPLPSYLMSADERANRVNPNQLKEDAEVMVAVGEMEGFTPANEEYALTKLTPLVTAMETAQKDEVKKEKALGTARDVSRAAEWAYHDFVQGVRRGVRDKYGENSTQAQAVGYIRKSERAKPQRKAQPTPPAQ